MQLPPVELTTIEAPKAQMTVACENCSIGHIMKVGVLSCLRGDSKTISVASEQLHVKNEVFRRPQHGVFCTTADARVRAALHRLLLRMRVTLAHISLALSLFLLPLASSSAAIAPRPAKFEVLYNFGRKSTDGYAPNGLIKGRDGRLYGITCAGGRRDIGVLFRLNATGSVTNLFSFGSDKLPVDTPISLLYVSNGVFLGATGGGLHRIGSIFRLNSKGRFSTLYSFSSTCHYPALPNKGLVRGRNGYLYGTESTGGQFGRGMVYRVSARGKFSTLYDFGSRVGDGAFPECGLSDGRQHDYYGTTMNGGADNLGTIFKIGSNGPLKTLYSFEARAGDGNRPISGVIVDSGLNVYGATHQGGLYDMGTLFCLTHSGKFKVLFSLGGRPSDAKKPTEIFVEGHDHNFYGTSPSGGIYKHGTIFRLTPTGSYTTLYSFRAPKSDGEFCDAPLVEGNNGTFFGVTFAGGAYGGGSLFKFTVK